MHILVGEALPQVNDVAYISHAHSAFLFHRLANGRNQFVETVVQLVYPSLCMTFLGSQRIDFSNDAHHSGNVACLWLSSRHASETRGYEEHSVDVGRTARFLHLLAGSVEHGDGSAVYDSLRTDIHI